MLQCGLCCHLVPFSWRGRPISYLKVFFLEAYLRVFLCPQPCTFVSNANSYQINTSFVGGCYIILKDTLCIHENMYFEICTVAHQIILH